MNYTIVNFYHHLKEMNSYDNAKFKGECENAGNNVMYFEKFNNLIQINDGCHKSFDRTVNCGGSGYADCPFGEGRETLIQMTHQDHDITEMDNSYFTLGVDVVLRAPGLGDTSADTDHLIKIQHGFKDSNQIIDRPRIMSDNTTTDYYQPESIREGFAYARTMLKTEKKTRKYTHSLAENVDSYSPSIAGSYIDLAELSNGASVTDHYELNIPYDDLAAFQAFDKFPNFASGQIALKTYISKNGMVYKFVNPDTVKEVKEYLEGADITTPIKFKASDYDHKFIQMGQSCKGITAIAEASSSDETLVTTSGVFTLVCDSITITSFKANIRGYNIKDKSKQLIAQDLSQNPKIVPCQFLEYNSWNAAATGGGINTNIKTALNSVSSILVAFPHKDANLTCFENPMYANLQLRIDGTNYPEEVFNTNDARFYQNQLIASDLDGAAECTQEFEESITMPRNAKDGSVYANTLRDNTAFLWEVPLERKGAGVCFDGYSSNDINVSVQITGQPIYTGSNDSYYNYASGEHPIPPQFWVISEKYFTFDTSGLHFHNKSLPPNSQTL